MLNNITCCIVLGLVQLYWPSSALAQSTVFIDGQSTALLEAGTQLFPYKTISTAVQQAQNGATLIVASGVYFENVSIPSPRRLKLEAQGGSVKIVGQAPPLRRDYMLTDDRVLVVCVKFQDLNSTRVQRCVDWVDILNSQAREYFLDATYNKTSFVFETYRSGPQDGWFPIPLNSPDRFMADNGVGQQIIRMIEPHVDFARYSRLLIISNKGSSNFGQNSTDNDGYPWFEVDEGIQRLNPTTGRGERRLNVTVMHQGMAGNRPHLFDLGASVACHELGHGVGARAHYSNGSRFHQWGIMDNPQTPPPHFLGWIKYDRGWLRGNEVTIITRVGGQETELEVDLKTHTRKTGPGTYLIMIPFVLSAEFEGYVVEYRVEGNSNWIPEEGVLIYRVDENLSGTWAIINVVDDPDFRTGGAITDAGALQKAAYEVGDTFEDAGREIRIEVLTTGSDSARVRVNYGW